MTIGDNISATPDKIIVIHLTVKSLIKKMFRNIDRDPPCKQLQWSYTWGRHWAHSGTRDT